MKRGFTLIEMLIAITLLALLLGFAAFNVPNFFGRQSTMVYGKRIKTDLITTRLSAMNTGLKYKVIFEDGGKTFSIYEEDPDEDRWILEREMDPLSGDTELSSTFRQDELVYDGMGKAYDNTAGKPPSESTESPISSDCKIIVEDQGSYKVDVMINPVYPHEITVSEVK